MTLVQNNGYFPLDLEISCPQTIVKSVSLLFSMKAGWQICYLSILSLKNPLRLFRKKSKFSVFHKTFEEFL